MKPARRSYGSKPPTCQQRLANAQKLVCGCTVERLAVMTKEELHAATGCGIDKAAMMLAAARMAREVSP